MHKYVCSRLGSWYNDFIIISIGSPFGCLVGGRDLNRKLQFIHHMSCDPNINLFIIICGCKEKEKEKKD